MGPSASNSAVSSRLFIQEAAGEPLNYVGCVGVRGVVIDPRQQEFVRSVDETGVIVQTLPRYPNPSPFDVTFGKNFAKWRSLFSKTKNGCMPNFFIASAFCEDMSRIPDPNYWDDGVWLYGVAPNSGYQLGNNIIIAGDPSQAVKREDQISMIPNNGIFVGKMRYGQIGTIPDVQAIKSVAIVDEGKCSQTICRPCDSEGCLDMLVSVGSDFMYSVDGGNNWTNISTSGVGRAQAFNGTAFMVKADAILLSKEVDAALADWTTATTDVAFSGLSNITQVDSKTLLVGGAQGAVWRSTNGGSVWVQIRVANAAYGDIVDMKYNRDTEQVIAIAKKNTTTVEFWTSNDYGKNWGVLDTHPVPAETYGASSNPEVLPAGPNTFLLVNGNIYKLACNHEVTTYAAVTLVGVTGKATGIGLIDPANPNGIWVTTYSSGVMSIWRSNDALNTAYAESLNFTISAGNSVVNPITVCHGKYGDSLIFAFANGLYYGRDFESFFAD